MPERGARRIHGERRHIVPRGLVNFRGEESLRRRHGEGIALVDCDHMKEVEVAQHLPSAQHH